MQVRYVGEREVPERMTAEHLRTEERVIEEVVTSPCSPLQCGGGNCGPTSRTMGNGESHSSTNPLEAPCAAFCRQRYAVLMYFFFMACMWGVCLQLVAYKKGCLLPISSDLSV